MPESPPVFYFAAMSPYSWFAAERIGGLLPQARWEPVFAGGLFRSAGRKSWGLDERREENIRECESRAAQHGLGPISWPQPWPTNDVHVARAMTYADSRGLLHEYALAAMRATFREGADLERHEVLLQVGSRSRHPRGGARVCAAGPERQGAAAGHHRRRPRAGRDRRPHGGPRGAAVLGR